MNTSFDTTLCRSLVGVVQAPAQSPDKRADFSIGLRRLSDLMEWSDGRTTLGRVIPPGARVLLKPNFVLHENEGSGGIAPLITDPALVCVAAEAALASKAAEVMIGDAPIQSCDFAALLNTTGLGCWSDSLTQKDERFKGIRDFRRTTCNVIHGVRVAMNNALPEERFVLFNLGKDSLLEPITDRYNRFRVSWYDPRLLAKTHRPGFHQYLVAREVIASDFIINLPKLKTHKKAGVTCALKNCIGINGNKEYLPHHRLGGVASGGDCYPGASNVKHALEHVADRQNITSSRMLAMLWHLVAAGLCRVARWQGDRLGIEGAWSGNDTVWRTALDINRILLYGKLDGSLAETPRRRIIHIADAVVAGHGDGPLSPNPLPLGLLFGSDNPVAADWVAARLLGYEPSKIPIVSKAFSPFRWPLAAFSSSAIRVVGDVGEGDPYDVLKPRPLIEHPLGWRSAVSDTVIGSDRLVSQPQLSRSSDA